MVLVVDDDSDWRALVAETLADEGFAVVTAADGRAACECFRRVNPAVVVTDVEMPSMDGGELLAQLHCLDRGLPVIVITAEDVRDAAPFTEAVSFIRKPATTDAVTAAVKEALLRRPLTRLRRTRLRRLWSAARAAGDAALERGHAMRGAGGPRRFALIAGIGLATAQRF